MLLTSHQQLCTTTQKINLCKLQSISHAWHTPYVATDFIGIPVTFTSHTSWGHLAI